MKLLFRQRIFSWFDSYDIYDEEGRTVYTVKGRLAWGHKVEIYNKNNEHVGTVKEEVLSFLPRFAMYVNGQYVGEIKKKLTLLKPVFMLNCNGWTVNGDFFQWEYEVADTDGRIIMNASKRLLSLTDTYAIHIRDEKDALYSLMIVLAIDAAKCSEK